MQRGQQRISPTEMLQRSRSDPSNFYLGGSAQVAPSALGCPPKTQLLNGGQTAKALRCNASQASKAKIDAI
jgi:hypothetical protein